MNELLKQESDKLARSWMQHQPAWLRNYLVAGVEDPRVNLQSILSRHFLVRALTAERFSALMEQEYRFAAVMSWLTQLAGHTADAGEFEAVLHALRQGADNAEGIEIPRFVAHAFAALPAAVGNLRIPNYIESLLSQSGQTDLHQASLNTFPDLWNKALAAESADTGSRHTVLEPACGSANDYRFLHAYGIARLLDYTGFDLCDKNIANARALFPGVRFAVGNVFAIAAPDKAFDLCFVHDLFEHLSPEGLQAAVEEVCRVTRQGLCIGFFNMDEIPDHIVRPVDEYHWNTLSMTRMRELFASHGFTTQVLHIGTFLHRQTGCEHTHNPNAYTFLLRCRDLKGEHPTFNARHPTSNP